MSSDVPEHKFKVCYSIDSSGGELLYLSCFKQVSSDDLKFTTVLYTLPFTGENKMSGFAVLIKNCFKKFLDVRIMYLGRHTHLKFSEVACVSSAGELREYITKHCFKQLSSIDVMQGTSV